MTRINGAAQMPRRIFEPEWMGPKKLNARQFKAHCNAFFARIGLPVCDYLDGIKSHERAQARKRKAKR